MKTQWFIILALVFALITAIFAVINVESVQVNFLFTTTDTPLILVILASTLLGGLTVGLFGIFRQYRLQKQIRDLQKKLDAIEDEHKQPPTKSIDQQIKEEDPDEISN